VNSGIFALGLWPMSDAATATPHFKHAPDAKLKKTRHFGVYFWQFFVSRLATLPSPRGLRAQPADATKKGPPDGSPFFTKQTNRLLWAA
jgi:hypothetical protein